MKPGTEPGNEESARPQPAAAGGFALITTLIMVALLTPVATLSVLHAHGALRLSHQARLALEVFYVAEAGMEHALADLAVDPAYERLLAGPDGVLGDEDDGEFPFQSPPPPCFPRPPFHYEVRVEPRDDAGLDIIARGFGFHAATQTVAVTVIRSPSNPALAQVAGWREVF